MGAFSLLLFCAVMKAMHLSLKTWTRQVCYCETCSRRDFRLVEFEGNQTVSFSGGPHFRPLWEQLVQRYRINGVVWDMGDWAEEFTLRLFTLLCCIYYSNGQWGTQCISLLQRTCVKKNQWEGCSLKSHVEPTSHNMLATFPYLLILVCNL